MLTSPFSNEALDLVLMTFLRKSCTVVCFLPAYAESALVGVTSGLVIGQAAPRSPQAVTGR